MKKLIYTVILGGLLTLTLNSCGEKKEQKKEEKKTITQDTVIVEKTCTYSLDNESVKLNFTAFKYTEKAGVGGGFDTLEVSSFDEEKTTISEALMNVKFSIVTGSTNTNNPDRDSKIKDSFFGSMKNSTEITGYIESIRPDGEGVILISMNGEDVRGPFAWTYENGSFSLTATVDVHNFAGADALAALNGVCEDLHKGEDGLSILWPNVDVVVEATIKEICE